MYRKCYSSHFIQCSHKPKRWVIITPIVQKRTVKAKKVGFIHEDGKMELESF